MVVTVDFRKRGGARAELPPSCPAKLEMETYADLSQTWEAIRTSEFRTSIF